MKDNSISLHNLKTYQAGLLQARAYRKLKTFISSVLKEYGISMPEWSFLGLICDHKSVRVLDLSTLLDVEPPFATRLSLNLEKRGLIKKEIDADDGRVKKVKITNKGKELVSVVEVNLRTKLKDYLTGITTKELTVYTEVLNKISRLP